MKLFWFVMVFGLTISSAHAFTVFEVTEPEGSVPFADNEHVLTWGENNVLGQGATISYSIATSPFSCFMAFESCSSLDSVISFGYEDAISSAFDRWASVANLSFTQVDDQAGDIILAGEYIWSSEIAHAAIGRSFSENEGEAFSQISWSEVHFSEAVYWSTGASFGYDFLTVATHEIGHALGLGHSEIEGALMYADYQGVNTLQPDDISGIQFLYGSVSAVPEPATYLQFLLGLFVLLGLTRRTKLQAYIGR